MVIVSREAHFAAYLFLGMILILGRMAGKGGDLEQPRAQSVRMLDVFAFGPLMVYAGARSSTLPGWTRSGLVFLGIGTIVYNGINFARVAAGNLDDERIGRRPRPRAPGDD